MARGKLEVASKILVMDSGGTKDIAMATPGKVSETSLRDMAKAPASPVTTAPRRSKVLVKYES